MSEKAWRRVYRQRTFDIGHRVVVVDGPVNADKSHVVGHYGHVCELLDEWILVDIEGRITGPVQQFAIDFPHGWAFRPEELEHAD